MLKFLLGVLVGAAAIWIYNFFQGSEDISWEQPLTTGEPATSSYNGPSTTETVASATGS